MIEYALSQLYLADVPNPPINDNPEDQEQMLGRCLNIYLRRHKSKLQSRDVISPTFSISQMVLDIKTIFNQLQSRLIGHISESSTRISYSRKKWSSKKLSSVCF